MRQPDPVDWSNFNPASKYTPPPPARDAEGRAILYSAPFPANVEAGETDEGYLEFMLEPIVLPNGHSIRFTRASVKLFEKNGKAQNANKIGTALRSAQVTMQPQSNDDYKAAVKAAAGRKMHFTIDWEAKSKENNEKVQGYLAFPEDPERPGQRKAILRKGDTYNVVDKKGNILETKTVQSEVLFANARVRYFVDPSARR